MYWPSQSHGLNLTEQTFYLLLTKLNGKCPKQLQAGAVEASQSIARAEIQCLVMMMHPRLRGVIDSKGFAAKY